MASTMIKKDKLLHIFTLVTLIFTVVFGLTPVACANTVLSDIEGHWAQSSIQNLVNEGIISGYSDGTFKPNNNITRAEFVSLIVRAFVLESGPGKVFSDTADHWARDAIGTASYYGLVRGYSDSIFGPDDPVTREQIAVMIVNATKVDPTKGGKAFTDIAQVAAWAEEAVAKATGAGLIAGYPDGTFRPKANATRAEAAVILARSLKLIEKIIPPPPPGVGVDEGDEGDGSGGGGGVGGGGAPSGPSKVPVSAVSVSGETAIGETLTAIVTPSGATVNYQWQRAEAEDGTYTDINGATAQTYILTDADAGKWIRVKVTGTGNYIGTVTSVPVKVKSAGELEFNVISNVLEATFEVK